MKKFARLLLLTCVAFAPRLTLAQECGQGNSAALLSGNYTFRFDAMMPRPLPNHTVVLRPVSILAGVVYDGQGKVTVTYSGFLTMNVGKPEAFSALVLKGTYCAYPNGFGSVNLSNETEGWSWLLIQAANGQELETLHKSTIGYAITFSQKLVQRPK